MCTLSGQDVDKLRRIGAETLEVIGHTSVVRAWNSVGTPIEMIGLLVRANQEMTEVTQGVYAARQLAMDEVRHQASQVGANDMVISTLTHHDRSSRVRERRLQAPLLHRLDARAWHCDCTRCARASSGPVGRSGDVNQPGPLVRHRVRRTADVDIRSDQHRGPRRARQRAPANERPWAVHVRPLGERVPVRGEGRLRAGGTGRRGRASTTSASSSRAGRQARRWVS